MPRYAATNAQMRGPVDLPHPPHPWALTTHHAKATDLPALLRAWLARLGAQQG